MSNRLISEGFKKALLREDTITGELCIIINKGDKGLNIVTSGGHGIITQKSIQYRYQGSFWTFSKLTLPNLKSTRSLRLVVICQRTKIASVLEFTSNMRHVEDCFDCVHCKCCGYHSYICDIDDKGISSGLTCAKFERNWKLKCSYGTIVLPWLRLYYKIGTNIHNYKIKRYGKEKVCRLL